MIDINKEIKELLEDICYVDLQYPDTPEAKEMLVIQEIMNESDIIIEGIEKMSYIGYQIDACAKSALRCNEIACEASRRMLEAGFHRDGSVASFDGNKRKVMRFSALIDTSTYQVYRR